MSRKPLPPMGVKTPPSEPLTARWSKHERDVMLGGSRSPDQRMLAGYFCDLHDELGRTLLEELAIRGYDVTTLRFSVKPLAAAPAPVDHC